VKRKQKLLGGLAMAGLVAGLVLTPMSANATVYSTPCGHATLTSATSTTVRDSGSGCYAVRARIDRYSNGGPLSYYGSENSVESYVSASNGTLIQHYKNVKPSSTWTGWSPA
jgi:hypothetical protein